MGRLCDSVKLRSYRSRDLSNITKISALTASAFVPSVRRTDCFCVSCCLSATQWKLRKLLRSSKRMPPRPSDDDVTAESFHVFPPILRQLIPTTVINFTLPQGVAGLHKICQFPPHTEGVRVYTVNRRNSQIGQLLYYLLGAQLKQIQDKLSEENHHCPLIDTLGVFMEGGKVSQMCWK